MSVGATPVRMAARVQTRLEATTALIQPAPLALNARQVSIALLAIIFTMQLLVSI